MLDIAAVDLYAATGNFEVKRICALVVTEDGSARFVHAVTNDGDWYELNDIDRDKDGSRAEVFHDWSAAKTRADAARRRYEKGPYGPASGRAREARSRT